jgi:hypothetical protein
MIKKGERGKEKRPSFFPISGTEMGLGVRLPFSLLSFLLSPFSIYG